VAAPWKNQVAIPDTANFDREGALRGLASEDKDVLLAALSQIGSAGPTKMLELRLGPNIAQLLGHQDPDVATAAVLALGSMGRAAAPLVQYFVMMLGNPNDMIKIAALEALASVGPTGDAAMCSAIASLASGGASAVRVAAITTLGAIDAFDQWQALLAALGDTSPRVRAAAIESVGCMASKSLEVESLFLKDIKVNTYNDLLADAKTQQSALASIAQLGTKAPAGVLGAVVKSLSAKDCSTRQAAVAAIGSMAEAVSGESVKGIEGLLKNSDAGVRAAAASALGAVGKSAASSSAAVAELLSDEAEDGSGLALQIGNGAKRAIPQLRSPKCAAVSALGLMGDGAYIGKVSGMSGDENWEVRLCVAEVLGMIGDKAASEAGVLKGLLTDDMYPVRAMACYALGRLKSEDNAAALVEVFEDSAPSVRKFALSAVGEIGPAASEYCHDVFKLLGDPVSHVRGAAALCLSRLGEQGAQYAAAVATLVHSEDAELRASVLEALGGMGEPAAVFNDELYYFLSDPVPAVQQAAANAMEALGASVPVLLKDSGAGPGVPVEEPSAGDYKGVGLYYAEVQKGKKELVAAGKWPEGIW